MSRRCTLRLITLLALICAGAPAAAQGPLSRPTTRPHASGPAFPGVPLPVLRRAPSEVLKPATDPDVVLGMHELTRERPAVVDGDTIRVLGLDRSLRLIGIDTEETFKDPGRRMLAEKDWSEYLRTMYAGARADRPPKFGTPFGEAARDFAERFFAGVKAVRLEYDHPRRKRGYYGRHLVHVLCRKQGRWINYNVEVVRQGLSPYFLKYGRSRRYHAAFLAAEKEARDLGRGLWALRPAFRTYPDYPVRLRWWMERAQAMEVARTLDSKDETVFILGEDGEWEGLKEQAGHMVTVIGAPGRLIRKRDLALQTIGHRNKNDFLVVGPMEKVAALGLERLAGDLVMITGRVSLYRGRPQFRVRDVTSIKPVPTH